LIMKFFDKRDRLAIGLMSGTSADGIDAALVEIDGDGPGTKLRLLEFINAPYSEDVRSRIFELFTVETSRVDKIGYMNFLLGELFADAAIAVAGKAGVDIGRVDFIGSHGQTIYHMPEICSEHGYDIRYSVQIGEGAVIAQRTGAVTVSDFRVGDIAAGGQGAPLVPYTEYILYSDRTHNTLLQNIGGISNITLLPAGCAAEQVIAFDTGPGNMVIDGLIKAFTDGRLNMDRDGEMAGRGRVNRELLACLLDDPYIRIKPPKSTGREYFGEEYVKRVIALSLEKGIPECDTVATATYLTAAFTLEAYRRYIKPLCKADRLITGGGGSYNPVLLGFLREEMGKEGIAVTTQEEEGCSSDAKEAAAFAILANETLSGNCNNIPAATGAAKKTVMGKISLP
jgi:anhydro-N-acetylmuramic acid kinase